MAIKGKGSSSKGYKTNRASYKKKLAYDKIRNARPKQKAYRRELERIRVKDKKKGADTSKTDYDHAVGKRVPKVVNRSRKEKSRVKGYKQFKTAGKSRGMRRSPKT